MRGGGRGRGRRRKVCALGGGAGRGLGGSEDGGLLVLALDGGDLALLDADHVQEAVDLGFLLVF